MTVLMWDKPEKVMTTEEWQSISADSAPPGVYVPNMSDDDKQRWKAKLVGKRAGYPHVEIRKTDRGCVQILLIVSLGGGYSYGSRHAVPDRWGRSTRGVNVQMSMN